MTAETEQDLPPWDQRVASYQDMFLGNEDAIHFMLVLSSWSHLYDDLIDQDKEIDPSQHQQGLNEPPGATKKAPDPGYDAREQGHSAGLQRRQQQGPGDQIIHHRVPAGRCRHVRQVRDRRCRQVRQDRDQSRNAGQGPNGDQRKRITASNRKNLSGGTARCGQGLGKELVKGPAIKLHDGAPLHAG